MSLFLSGSQIEQFKRDGYLSNLRVLNEEGALEIREQELGVDHSQTISTQQWHVVRIQV